ncbi:MAG TPA: DegV family protein [Spirochaetia bacterium]|nr:DegV family protein [Spirochaetia bacterium]
MSDEQISYVDGRRFKRALIAGARRVIQFKDQLNSINVFPVADSDTGTNMAGTLHAVTSALSSISDRSLAVVTRTAADSALQGARGNSGTILAQFFHGMAEELKNYAYINTQTFAGAVHNAVKYAYEAITVPMEGTILTVLQSWSERLLELCRKTGDFSHMVGESVSAARIALATTKDKLPSLKKAGVVDAGAQGFVHFIEGVAGFMRQGKIREIEKPGIEPEIGQDAITEYEEEITFRYCTECMIEGDRIDHNDLRERLRQLGDSLIVAGSKSVTKLHIHTDSPSQVFEIAGRFGVLHNQKAEDMRKQYEAAHGAHGDIALVLDSGCDLPEELLSKPFVHVVPLTVMVGETTYIDKVSLTPAGFYDLLRGNPHALPTTSQPPQNDYLKLFGFLSRHYSNILVLSVSGGLSGTCGTARRAAATADPGADRIHVIDSKSVSVGVGLIARRICALIESGKTFSEVESAALELVSSTQFYVSVESLDSLIRSGRVGRAKGLFARLLRLLPVLFIAEDGTAETVTVVRTAAAGRKRIMNIIRKSLSGLQGERFDFAIAHVDARSEAEEIARQISTEFPQADRVMIEDAAPALATHTGFGTVGIGFIRPGPDRAANE